MHGVRVNGFGTDRWKSIIGITTRSSEKPEMPQASTETLQKSAVK